MKYERKEQNRIKKERLANLVQLYIDTDDINVFLINLHIRYYDLIGYVWKFKFYYFKTMHPFWSAFLHLVPTFIVSVLMALFYAAGVVTLEIMILSIPLTFVLTLVIMELLCGNLYRQIEWHENGCPRDY